MELSVRLTWIFEGNKINSRHADTPNDDKTGAYYLILSMRLCFLIFYIPNIEIDFNISQFFNAIFLFQAAEMKKLLETFYCSVLLKAFHSERF